MDQDITASLIADDYSSIAARMRELNTHSKQITIYRECGACDSRGWVWSATVFDWRRCPHCGLSEYCPKPKPRR